MHTPQSPFHRLAASPQPGVGKAVVGEPTKKDNRVGITVTVAIFFDGTLNNRTNTTERITKSAVAATTGKGQTSYVNYYSNVAIMEYLNSQRDAEAKQTSVYIEGEGTDDRKEDDKNGYAFGDGTTGIPSKVTKGINSIVSRILAVSFYDPEKQRIDKIACRVFGFSRGAAAARHFISRKKELCTRLGVAPTVVEFPFVGLFDTVSSYKHGASFATNVATVIDFKNDVEELHLRLTDPAIRKVVHLVAGDEYRENFPSTTIASAIAAGKGYELVLPGVHSDVGGGYGEVEEEDRLGEPEELLRLVEEGWYLKKQVSTLMGRASRTLPYSYQLLPLGIMVKLATKYGLVLTHPVPWEVTLAIPADLLAARAQLLAYALHHDGAHRKAVTLPQPLLGEVRNGYLHRSAKKVEDQDSTGMQGRLKDGLPDRLAIPG